MAADPCPWCGQVRPLVESVILDGAFFPLGADGAPHPGVRDRIVCANCAPEASAWDALAIDLLFTRRDEYKQGVNSLGKPFFRLEPADATGFKLFALSLLWRAARSKHRWCAAVKLGPFEAVILKALKDKAPGKNDVLPVVLIRRDQEADAASMSALASDRDWGVRVYHAALNGWELALQVDKQPFIPVNAAAVRPGEALVAQSQQHFTDSFGVDILKAIAAEKPKH
jgi:hypothetical protein